MLGDGGQRMIRKTGRIGLGWLEVRNSGLSGKLCYAYIYSSVLFHHPSARIFV